MEALSEIINLSGTALWKSTALSPTKEKYLPNQNEIDLRKSGVF